MLMQQIKSNILTNGFFSLTMSIKRQIWMWIAYQKFDAQGAKAVYGVLVFAGLNRVLQGQAMMAVLAGGDAEANIARKENGIRIFTNLRCASPCGSAEISTRGAAGLLG